MRCSGFWDICECGTKSGELSKGLGGLKRGSGNCADMTNWGGGQRENPGARSKIRGWSILFVPGAMGTAHILGHYLSIIDLWLVGFSIVQISLGLVAGSGGGDRHYFPRYVFTYLLYLGLISSGFIYAEDSSGVFKELSKWAEIFLISVGVMLYVRNESRLATFYWAMVFFLVGVCAKHLLLNALTGDFFARMFVPVDWAIILILPFLRLTWVKVLCLAIIFPSLIMSYSRLSWASTLLAVIVFWFLAKQRRMQRRQLKRITLASIAVLGAIIIFVPQFSQIVTQRLSVTFDVYQDQSAFTRAAMDAAAVSDIMNYPMIGVGPGNFKYHLIRRQTNINFWLAPAALPNSPHSVLLQTGAEMGVLGLLALGGVLLIVVLGIRRGGEVGKECTSIRPYSMGLTLFLIPLFVTLVASNIGEFYRVIWGIYFGLSLSMFKFHGVMLDEEARANAT